MRATIRNITSKNKTYPYTVYLQENILHLFKRKHVFYADHEFSFLKKISKKGKETTIVVSEQTKGEYVLQMVPCTGEYLFKEEIYVNDYLVKKVKPVKRRVIVG